MTRQTSAAGVLNSCDTVDMAFLPVVELHPPEARPDEGENSVGDESGPDGNQQVGAEGVVAERLEAAVQSRGFVGVMLRGGNHKEQPGEAQGSAFGDMA